VLKEIKDFAKITMTTTNKCHPTTIVNLHYSDFSDFREVETCSAVTVYETLIRVDCHSFFYKLFFRSTIIIKNFSCISKTCQFTKGNMKCM
jgi:hypothetical protein